MQHTDTRTRLRLEGVPSPIVTRVTRRSRDTVTLHQPLPFLQLHGSVEDESGRRGRIEWVDVTLEGNVPSLVLEVSYPPPAPEPAVVRSATEPSPKRRDATVPFELPTARMPSHPPIAVGDPAADARPPAHEGRSWWKGVLRWLRRLLPRFARSTSHRLPAPAPRG